MNHSDKIVWLALWAANNACTFVREGSCGFGRECVGMLVGRSYIEYEWHDPKTYERIDQNGRVWTPPDAYHKHPCVAVLGHGEAAEAQLFEWVQWFDANGFKLETGEAEFNPHDLASVLLGKTEFARMVRQPIKYGPLEGL